MQSRCLAAVVRLGKWGHADATIAVHCASGGHNRRPHRHLSSEAAAKEYHVTHESCGHLLGAAICPGSVCVQPEGFKPSTAFEMWSAEKYSNKYDSSKKGCACCLASLLQNLRQSRVSAACRPVPRLPGRAPSLCSLDTNTLSIPKPFMWPLLHRGTCAGGKMCLVNAPSMKERMNRGPQQQRGAVQVSQHACSAQGSPGSSLA